MDEGPVAAFAIDFLKTFSTVYHNISCFQVRTARSKWVNNSIMGEPESWLSAGAQMWQERQHTYAETRQVHTGCWEILRQEMLDWVLKVANTHISSEKRDHNCTDQLKIFMILRFCIVYLRQAKLLIAFCHTVVCTLCDVRNNVNSVRRMLELHQTKQRIILSVTWCCILTVFLKSRKFATLEEKAGGKSVIVVKLLSGRGENWKVLLA